MSTCHQLNSGMKNIDSKNTIKYVSPRCAGERIKCSTRYRLVETRSGQPLRRVDAQHLAPPGCRGLSSARKTETAWIVVLVSVSTPMYSTTSTKHMFQVSAILTNNHKSCIYMEQCHHRDDATIIPSKEHLTAI